MKVLYLCLGLMGMLFSSVLNSSAATCESGWITYFEENLPEGWVDDPSVTIWRHSSDWYGMGGQIVKPEDSSFLFTNTYSVSNITRDYNLMTPAFTPTQDCHFLTFEIQQLLTGTQWLGAGEELYIEFSEDGGSTWTTSTENILATMEGYNTTGTEKKIFIYDLTEYIDKEIKARFREKNDYGGCVTILYWVEFGQVTNEPVECGILETYFEENLPEGWLDDPSVTIWRHSSDWYGMGGQIVKPEDSSFLFTNTYSVSNTTRDYNLMTPAFTPTQDCHLFTFEIQQLLTGTQWLRAGEELYIEFSEDGGSSWTASTENILATMEGYNTTGTERKVFTYNLSEYIGKEIKVRFRERNDAGGCVTILYWVKVAGEASGGCLPIASLDLSLSGSTLTLNWQAAEGADKYSIYKNDILIASDIAELTYSDVLDANGEYTYCVTAHKGNCESTKTCKTVYIGCNPVKDLDYGIEGSIMILSWSAPDNATPGLKYNVYRNGELIEENLNVPTFEQELKVDGFYSYCVTTVLAECESIKTCTGEFYYEYPYAPTSFYTTFAGNVLPTGWLLDGYNPYSYWKSPPLPGNRVSDYVPFEDGTYMWVNNYFLEDEGQEIEWAGLITPIVRITGEKPYFAFHLAQIIEIATPWYDGIEIYVDITTDNCKTWIEGTNNLMEAIPNYPYSDGKIRTGVDVSDYIGKNIRLRIRAVIPTVATIAVVDEIKITKLPDDLAPISQLSAAQVEKDVVLTWNAPSEVMRAYIDDPTAYKVVRDGVLLTKTLTETTYTDVDIAANPGTYDYTVTPIYNDEIGDDTVVTIAVKTASPCAEVSDLSAILAEGGNEVSLVWTVPNTVAQDIVYNIYRNGEQIASNVSETSYEDLLNESGSYIYSVRATRIGEDCESEDVYTNAIDFIFICDEYTMTNLSLEAISGSGIKLTWEIEGDAPMKVLNHEGFEDEEFSWSVYDVDGDGHNWFRMHETSNGELIYYAASNSFYEVQLTTDNWMVSPAITLLENSQLSYLIRNITSWPDTYGVYIATENPIDNGTLNVNKFTLLKKDTPETSLTFTQENVSLADYGSAEVWIAFRHFESPEGWIIHLDEITVQAPSSDTYLFNIYRNESLIAENVSGRTYEDYDYDYDSGSGIVTYEVAAAFGYCETNKVSNSITTVDINDVIDSSVSVYPTVTSGEINIITAGEATIRVMDVSGRLLEMHTSSGNLKLTLDYQNGIYLIIADEYNKTSTHKVMIKR